MVDKEVAITRLQNTLLRLPKDDLIKLLKSTYQAMRIKHGIPYERNVSINEYTPVQRNHRERGTKALAVPRSKAKPSASRKKLTESSGDMQEYGVVEQPTFRQVDSYIDEFNDLSVSTHSRESDRTLLPEPAEYPDVPSRPRSGTSPTYCISKPTKSAGHMEMSDRDVEVGIPREKSKYYANVPLLDLSGVLNNEKDPYRSHESVTDNRINAPFQSCNVKSVPRMNSIPVMSTNGASPYNQPLPNQMLPYGPGNMAMKQVLPPNGGVPLPCTMTTHPANWVPGYNVPKYKNDYPHSFQGRPMRALHPSQMGYRDSYPIHVVGPFQPRARPVQRL